MLLIDLCDFGLGKDFLGMIPKDKKHKKKIHKLDFAKNDYFVLQRC